MDNLLIRHHLIIKGDVRVVYLSAEGLFPLVGSVEHAHLLVSETVVRILTHLLQKFQIFVILSYLQMRHNHVHSFGETFKNLVKGMSHACLMSSGLNTFIHSSMSSRLTPPKKRMATRCRGCSCGDPIMSSSVSHFFLIRSRSSFE